MVEKRDNLVGNKGENNGIIAGEIHGDVHVHNDNKSVKFPSLIPEIVEKLAEITNIPDEELDKIYKINKLELKEYKIDDKIEYNDVIEYKDIIDEYSEYGNICDHAFNVIDDNNIGIKRKILRNINSLYKKSKGQFLKKNRGMKEIDVIRENSDAIITSVIDTLTERINGQNILIEDIEDGLSRIICYAFIHCKILEKPR